VDLRREENHKREGKDREKEGKENSEEDLRLDKQQKLAMVLVG
jgi:hypothetical protein